MEVWNIPGKALKNPRRYEIFHGGDETIHGGIKCVTEGVK